METTNKYNNCLDIYNPIHDKQPKIVIVGAGGIGCWTTFALAQMWFNNITVIDFDEVELKNTSSQLYRESDIWRPKVTALQENVAAFTGITITPIVDRYKKEYTDDADIVIMAIDNMATRREVAESLTTKTERMIDCRMAWEFFEIYNYIPVYELQIYLSTWYTDEEASPVTCTSKSTSFNTFAIAAFITRMVVWITKWDKTITNRSQLTVDLHNLMIS